MTAAKFSKLMALITGVAVIDILVLSPGFIGLRLGASALSTAIGATLLCASALTIIYGSYTILFKQPVKVPIKQIRTHDDYVDALTRYKSVKALEDDMMLALEQLERIRKKRESLFDVLKERFDPAEISFKKFSGVIEEVEKLFYLNVRSILGRLSVFDESDYKRTMRQPSAKLSPELIQEKAKLYEEFLAFVKGSLGTNEEILLKLDRLLLEISRLDGLDPNEIENMPCMREIDSLIKLTKYYKS
ncbi:hypothetical protein GE107_10795 [Cohnella sp. CFH 77786]|uniref:hypothetical protein n=1 Tax=Cohnella sp. CFH 77786 TaxID=2662265 RepID=UPI001C60ECCA|nr:hypothetical protein [Cohnella sp. CFH 77786]MBW5446546.1 hypothetical protein [Cohnella sp. CFH 77786]